MTDEIKERIIARASAAYPAANQITAVCLYASNVERRIEEISELHRLNAWQALKIAQLEAALREAQKGNSQ